MAFYGKTATVRANKEPVMLIANPLDKPFDDYSTKAQTRLQSKLELLLLTPDTARTTDVSTLASYRTADDGVNTLDSMAMIEQMFPLHISQMSYRQGREALARLTQGDAGVSCWLCGDGQAMYRFPYLTYDQQFFTAYQNFEHHTAATQARNGS